MKKLTILFILVFLEVGLFANPKIPKTKDYLLVAKSLSADDCVIYVNNSGQNVYRLFKEVYTNHYTLWFINESLVTGIKIEYAIGFDDEKTMDDFSNHYITSYDLESEFIDFRESFINSEIIPLITEDELGKVKEILYMVSY